MACRSHALRLVRGSALRVPTATAASCRRGELAESAYPHSDRGSGVKEKEISVLYYAEVSSYVTDQGITPYALHKTTRGPGNVT